MRTSREDKQKTAQRIVDGAARLMRERGIEATSVADVMNEAGLTHGGFYRHFDGKDALMLAALEAAFAERHAALEQRFRESSPADALAGYRDDYLSQGHTEAAAIGCPLPALAGDVARASEPLRAAYGANVQRAVRTLAQGIPGSGAEAQARAAREIAMLVGALVLARASDKETAKLILDACRGANFTQGNDADAEPAQEIA
jgi:TetR/AcrR family transcriptional repressor of nem operon